MNMHYAVGEERLDWLEAETALLRKLWARKVITKEIARQIGRTDGAVTAKARRLKLPRRRMDDKRVYGCVQLTKLMHDMIRENSHKLGIAKAEYIRRAIERCSIEAIAE